MYTANDESVWKRRKQISKSERTSQTMAMNNKCLRRDSSCFECEDLLRDKCMYVQMRPKYSAMYVEFWA